ncbi:MAG TPA: hypothetical protein PLO06_11455 [Methanoregulaceae archaeon]|nr:hypothetical protein [Methanoregulaceae archaeon]
MIATYLPGGNVRYQIDTPGMIELAREAIRRFGRSRSRIRCTGCGRPVPHAALCEGRCDQCSAKLAAAAPERENWPAHNERMAKGMVLSNSCDYGRWS